MMLSGQTKLESAKRFITRINQTFAMNCANTEMLNDEKFERNTKKTWLKEGIRRELWDFICYDLQNGNDQHLSWDDMSEAAVDAEFLYNFNCPTIKPWMLEANKGNFKVDNDGRAVVYTAGACVINGKSFAKAGIGVYFSSGHQLNVVEPLISSELASKTAAEIYAAIKAILIAKRHGVYRLTVHTGFRDLYKAMTGWIFIWLQNGWLHLDGKPVADRKHYRKLLSDMEHMDIKWVYVPAIRGVKGHVRAQRFAVKAVASSYMI